MKKIKLILISLLGVFGTLYATNDCGSPTALAMNTDDCSPTNHNIGTATATVITEPCGVATHDDWFFEFTTNALQGVAVIRVGNFRGTNQFGGGTTPLLGELSIYTSCSSSPLYCVNLSEWTTHTIPELLPGTSYLVRISYFDNSIIVSEEIDICVIQPALGEICGSPFPLLTQEGACTLEQFNLEDISTLNSDLPVSCGSVDYHDVYFEFTTNSEEVNIQTGDFFEIIEAAYLAVYEECGDEVFCSTLSKNSIYFVENLIVGSNYQIRVLFAPGGAPTLEICVYEPCVFYTWFGDTDSDTYGDVSNSLIECFQPIGYVDDSTDCDDTNPDINPGALEICNDIDDDCNGLIDMEDPDVTGLTRWFADNDEDDYGDPLLFVDACRTPGDNWVEDSTDCDDDDENIHPGADELCDGTDNNCDGLTDDDDPTVIGQTIWYEDADNDGYGNLENTLLACFKPENYVENPDDCDDNEPDVYTGAPELCDGMDNNCDGVVDEGGDIEVEIQEQDSSVLFANVTGNNPPYTFLWITGATTQSIDFQAGIIWVEVTDSLGCIDLDSIVITSVLDQFHSVMKVYPIPTQDILIVDFSDRTSHIDRIEVLDIYGKIVYSEHHVNSSTSIKMDVTTRSAGYYFLRVIQNGKHQIKEFIVVKE
jgi:hypothetical protein